jgi:hypothetical protein
VPSNAQVLRDLAAAASLAVAINKEMSNGTGHFDYHKTSYGRRLGGERLRNNYGRAEQRVRRGANDT